MSVKKDLTEIGVLEPHERLKALINYSNAIVVDPHVPPRRYYRSGLEMVRMANVYLKEGNLENAYILYLKFMTLFLEKIKKHPDYATVSANEKSVNLVKMREVLPKAEKLKVQLLERYTKEYNRYLQEQKQRESEQKAREAKARDELKRQQQIHNKVVEDSSKAVSLSIPGSIDSISYPDPNQVVSESPKPAPTPSAPSLDLTPSSAATPPVNRNAKPPVVSNSVSFVRSGLRTVIIPKKVMSHFLNLAQRSTMNNIETCGVLTGKLEQNELIITHMILPKQKGTSDSCLTMNEEEIFDYQDKHNLITIGWIHTHPTQTAFLSSVDLHTHCPYQLLMPEAIAIVCAPRYDQTGFFILTPNYGLDYIAGCRKTGFHPHPTDPPLFMNAEHIKIDNNAALDVLDLRT